MSDRTQGKAIILLAHGTKEPEASEPVHQYARELAKRSGLRVEPCLREFIEPSVPTVVAKLAEEQFNELVVVPFFLFHSGHVIRDIRNDVAAQQQKFPNIKFRIGQPLGFDVSLVDLLERRLREAIQG